MTDDIGTSTDRPAVLTNIVGTDSAFGLRVKQHRTARDWTYRELGERAGIAYSILWRAEHGRGVTLRHAVLIASALEVPLPLLLEPVACGVCLGSPPTGYICKACGAEGADLPAPKAEAS